MKGRIRHNPNLRRQEVVNSYYKFNSVMSLIKKTILFFVLSIFCLNSTAQQDDSLMLRKIYDEVLVNGKAYDWLYELTKTVGARLSGSAQAEQAVKLVEKK